MESEKLIPGHIGPTEKLVCREKPSGVTFKNIMRDMGLKVTKPRLAILEALSNGRAHVSAQELYEQVKVTHKEVGFATVYRFLRELSKDEYVTEVNLGRGPARYELKPNRHHDHLTCTECSCIVEFENPQIERLQELVAIQNGFQLTGHVLELYGKCSDCLRQG